ncbi:DUF397 domain-containing protein [Herbidospora yilanensis]|uniref:DUF397 domain-containing protein n=1 Tax=Herbidospora yilanensis TaxID=354426 RepID=UPI000A7299C0|nr:DUF397 domain-containing protein [Herbidospora yilanensis]
MSVYMDMSRAVWRKSSFSGTAQCVEVARLDEQHVGVRDSKNESGPALIFTPQEWRAFVGGVKNGEFDL